jgi:hypothetical protein
MDADRFFLETLRDLQKRVDSAQPEYNVLMAAGLLRKLLLDEQRVTDRVNRGETRRLKIKYRINDRQPIWQVAGGPRPTMWSMEDGFDPDTATRAQPLAVTRDQLLARVVMLHKGYEVTVKDLIDHAAHVGGAIHLGEPRTEREKALSDLAAQINIGGYAAATRALQALGRVVLKGLAPLKARVERDLAG